MINFKVSIFLVLTVIFFNTTEGLSADIRKGLAAYKRGDYVTAVREWKPFARKGHAKIQNIMGTMYLTGKGVRQNNKEAAKWYKLAAKQGLAGAQFNLGFLYAKGKGVPQNYKTAAEWFSLASKQGHAGAQSGLKKLNKILKKSRRGRTSFVAAHKRKKEEECEWKKTGEEMLTCRINAARKQIIASISEPVLTKRHCDHTEMWRETMLDTRGYFLKPKLPNSYFQIGGVGTNDNNKEYCNKIVRINPNIKADVGKYLVPAKKWKMVWSNGHLDSHREGSFWRGVAPNNNFVCLGDVVQKGFKKPNLPRYRCIHKRFLRKIKSSSILWTDAGSESEDEEKHITIFNLKTSGLFASAPGQHESHEWWDLKAKLSTEPDPGVVEALLEKRIPKIKVQVSQLINKRRVDEQKTIAKEKAAAKRRVQADKERRAQAKRLAKKEAKKKKLADAKRRKAEAKRKAIKFKREQKFRNAKSFIKKYQNREKTLLEQVLNYAEFSEETGNLAKSAMWVQSGNCSVTRHKFFWKYREKGKNKVGTTRSWDFSTHWEVRAGRFQLNKHFYGLEGWKKAPTINLKKANQTAFRIKTKIEQNWITKGYYTATLSTDFKTFKIKGPESIVFDRLQKAWTLAFQKCPGKKSAF